MSKRITVRQLADLAENFRYLHKKDVVEAEYEKGSHSGRLSRIRFSRDEETGRPTKRIIDCLDDGTLRHYDKKYEVELKALIIDGHRIEVPTKC